MENERAMFMANNMPPAPWETTNGSSGEPPKPRRLREATPGIGMLDTGVAMPGDKPLTSDQFAFGSNKEKEKMTYKYRPSNQAMAAPSSSQSSSASSLPRGYAPLVPDQLATAWDDARYFESRSAQVAANSASRNAGAMVNPLASQTIRPDSVKPKTPDQYPWTQAENRSRSTGLSMPGDKPITYDQMEFKNERAAKSETMFSTGYPFQPQPVQPNTNPQQQDAGNQEGYSGWSDWKNQNSIDSSFGVDSDEESSF